ncbi:MAG: flagellar hook-associated protein FlgK [Halobacteriovoraceae bacterium]|nr:flagellar hook-associated protein FlgK [Halobacteriovoraceae bacterium]
MADLLNIGNSGLFAAKKALETTGHNIANANTEGYTRQRINLQSTSPVTQSGLNQGNGVRVKDINRIHDPYIEKRLVSNLSSSKYFENRTGQLEQVEMIFNEIDNEGLNKILNRFFNSFRELANQPENETIRSVVRDNAQLIVKDFKRIRETLGDLTKNIDRNIIQSLDEVNIAAKHIAELNTKITTMEASGDETGDLRDKRDQHIRTIAEYFDVHTYQDEKNRFVVSIQGVGTLVAAGEVQSLNFGTNPDGTAPNNQGSIDIFFEDRKSFPVTSKIRGGKIGALISVRDGDLDALKSQIDQIAYNTTKSVNAIHRRGFVNREIDIIDGEEPVKFDRRGPTGQINFFEDIKNVKGAAEKIELSYEVKEDLSNIITALDVNSPGDNRIALAISKLQHEKILDNGTTTLEEKYLQSIGNVGMETGKSRLDQEQAEGLLTQSQTIKERVSGVSIDEETSNLVRFQHAYEASAKVMSTADDMFKTVLALKK